MKKLIYCAFVTLIATSPSFGAKADCIQMPKLHGASYSLKDLEKEQALCGIDFESSQVKLCPKTWSTSPSTIILDLAKGQQLQPNTCLNKKTMQPFSKIAKFKVSMNESGTSATFSQASILYYHLSRYLNTSASVPVSVYKTMDKTKHFDLVSSKAVSFENEIIKTAWSYLKKAESVDVNSISSISELFILPETKLIFGALIDSIGNEKYGEFMRGKKQPAWGLEQHLELKNTPVFKALSDSRPLLDAVDNALKEGKIQFKSELGLFTPSHHQMISWMQEMSDMALLDYILQQQDRPGNIHFQWRIYYTKNGQLKSDRIKATFNGEAEGVESRYPLYRNYGEVELIPLEKYNDICASSPCYILQKTWLEDNDAAGRINYKSFYREAGILESIGHMNLKTYMQLKQLVYDLNNKATLHEQLKNNYNLDQKQFEQLKRNATDAYDLLRAQCKSGKLKFDLDAEKFMLSGKILSEKLSCDL